MGLEKIEKKIRYTEREKEPEGGTENIVLKSLARLG